jgi:hypothetical protein
VRLRRGSTTLALPKSDRCREYRHRGAARFPFVILSVSIYMAMRPAEQVIQHAKGQNRLERECSRRSLEIS